MQTSLFFFFGAPPAVIGNAITIILLLVLISILIAWMVAIVAREPRGASASITHRQQKQEQQRDHKGGNVTEGFDEHEDELLNEKGRRLTCKRLRNAITKHGERCKYLSEDNSFCIGDKCVGESEFERIIRVADILQNVHDDLDEDLKRQIEEMKKNVRGKKDDRALAISDDVDTIIDNIQRFEARGGSDTEKKGDYTYHYFKRNGVFEVVHGRNKADIFLVGGGGCGGRGGGGGGYTHTARDVMMVPGFYKVVVGRGGVNVRREDGEASMFGDDIVANGGQGGGARNHGGSGGGGIAWDNGCVTSRRSAGNGGSNGGSGKAGFKRRFTRRRCWRGAGWIRCYSYTVTLRNTGGRGQGGNTREFGESNGKLYAGGGGGMHCDSGSAGNGGDGGGGRGGGTGVNGLSGLENTGGGGGGSRFATPGDGGSGIVIVRYKLS